MSTAAAVASATQGARRDLVEIVATIVLALGRGATAWSSYEANRWNGEQAKATSRRTRSDRRGRGAGLAGRREAGRSRTYIQWADAYATDNTVLQDFYLRRFRPEFKSAFEAWMETKPFSDPAAPLTPFALPQYRPSVQATADRLDRQAAASANLMQRNILRSANYVLAVVLFAVVLFFCGMSARLRTPDSGRPARARLCHLRRRRHMDRDVSGPVLGVNPRLRAITRCDGPSFWHERRARARAALRHRCRSSSSRPYGSSRHPACRR